MNLQTRLLTGVVLACLLMVASASATTITFETAVGATAGGQPVDAKAIFTTGLNTLSITLEDLQANPTSVVQSISGLGFTLSSGQTSGTLSSSAGMERSIPSTGIYTDGSIVAAGWVLTGLFLDDLSGTGHAGPAHTLIGGPNGSNIYTGNSSILNNGPHNPFLAGNVTFVLSITGLTDADSVAGVTFQFGTADGENHITVRRPTVPDGGATVGLLGLGLIGLAGLRRRLIRR